MNPLGVRKDIIRKRDEEGEDGEELVDLSGDTADMCNFHLSSILMTLTMKSLIQRGRKT